MDERHGLDALFALLKTRPQRRVFNEVALEV